MSSAVETRLQGLGRSLPKVAAPVASYVPAVRSGDLVFTSGQLPIVDGQLVATGKVGAEVSSALAHNLAAVCALNAMAAVKDLIGDLDLVVQVVKVVGFVASDADFDGQPAVINGASDLLSAAFGDAGQHARSAVGVAVLPRNAPVEVEVIVQVRSA